MSESASTDGSPALRVRDVAKRFRSAVALDRASLELQRGERLALLGPNGAGKTTLVRCICGRAVPDAGEIEMLGERLPPTGGRQGLGFVPQEVALYPDLTARENLEAFGRFHGLRGGELRKAVQWALGWTGLSDRARELTKTFSGGMKRRVNIACGVLHRPRVLLLDEPTVGVDPQSRERIFAMLDELRDHGTSILLTTHQLDEAEQRCDRIVIIDHGRVIAGDALRARRGHGWPEAPGDAPPGRAGAEARGLPGGRWPAGARGRGGGRGPRAAGPSGEGPRGRRRGERRRGSGALPARGLHPPHRAGAAGMIWTVVRVGLLRIWHGRVALLLDFAVPIAFFTIFAFIFGGQVGLGKSPRVNVALVDEDGTDLSRKLMSALAEQETLHVYSPERGEGGPTVFATSGPARALVLEGGLPLAVVVPRGWTTSFLGPGEEEAVQVLADSSDPVATQVVSALIRQVAGQIRGEQARRQIEAVLGPPPPRSPPRRRPASRGRWASRWSRSSPRARRTRSCPCTPRASPSCSCCSAPSVARALLEEAESQTLERLMCSSLGMTRLLAGKWLLLTIVGIAQVTVMFAWAQLAFRVDLVGHLPGFAAMTAVTAGAASSLALALATACRTRAQLNAVAIILILTMSALGGSMVPRYVMSGTMREIGRLTFNAWALDGYTKVFWRGLPLRALLPEVAVLVAAAAVLFLLARLLARRWESV